MEGWGSHSCLKCQGEVANKNGTPVKVQPRDTPHLRLCNGPAERSTEAHLRQAVERFKAEKIPPMKDILAQHGYMDRLCGLAGMEAKYGVCGTPKDLKFFWQHLGGSYYVIWKAAHATPCVAILVMKAQVPYIAQQFFAKDCPFYRN